MSYVELHARSAFSFLRGASNPEQLVEIAGKVGLSALALCDRNGVHGAPRAYAAAKENGLRSLVGSELTMEDETILPVLVMNRTGYRNLCRLLTQAQLRAPKGESRIHWTELGEYSEGLIALTGDNEGPLYRPVLQADRNEAEAVLDKVIRAFGSGHVYMELQRHRIPDEELVNEGLVQLASAHGIPIVATNGVKYAEAWGCDVLDVFTCIRHHTHLDLAGLLLALNAQCHLKSPKQMSALFADLPEAIENSSRIAERLEFTLNDLGYAFPEYPVSAGETMDSQLRKLTYFGAQQRYGSINGPVREQLEKELALITKLKFSGYFLIVWDIVNFAREEGILVQGRGSAANSAVCYALGITAVDPVGG
jgi:error-prone DNA polymerase